MGFYKTVLRLGVLAFALVSFASANVDADTLVLEFKGTTVTSSLNGTPITDGTPFTVDAAFDSTPLTTVPGFGTYQVSGITAIVGGTSYSASFSPGDYQVLLLDPSNGLFPGIYFSILADQNSHSFAPLYLNSTPRLRLRQYTPVTWEVSGRNCFLTPPPVSSI